MGENRIELQAEAMKHVDNNNVDVFNQLWKKTVLSYLLQVSNKSQREECPQLYHRSTNAYQNIPNTTNIYFYTGTYNYYLNWLIFYDQFLIYRALLVANLYK